MSDATLEEALAATVGALRKRGRRFALVGGLAISVRAEIRFTRDIDLAVEVRDDQDAEALVRDLRAEGFGVVATVEHDVKHRLATVRLVIRGVKVELLCASSGIEPEIVAAATPIEVLGAGAIPVAIAEDLLATKVLSMTDRRLQDRIDARKLLQFRDDLRIDRVRSQLALIQSRGFHQNQDLDAKLSELLEQS